MQGAAALEALVENRHLFLRFLESRVGDRATAEDILQEGFGRAAGRVAATLHDRPDSDGFAAVEQALSLSRDRE